MMRWIIKIILFPISLLLSILTAFMTFILGIGTTILYFLMLMCIVAAIGSFMQKDVSLGIEALVLGFLLSPYGIPMIGAAAVSYTHLDVYKRQPTILQRVMNIRLLGLQGRFLVYIVKARVIMTLRCV